MTHPRFKQIIKIIKKLISLVLLLKTYAIAELIFVGHHFFEIQKLSTFQNLSESPEK